VRKGGERFDSVVELQGTEAVVHRLVTLAFNDQFAVFVVDELRFTERKDIEVVNPAIVRIGVFSQFLVI
jgi:thymidine kinase